jgi:aryl-alcohol dehydrogenase-like predicted oxidoreductase
MGFGTGGGPDPLGQKSGRSRDEMIKLILDVHELGISHFDTSPGYMDSEVILGQALGRLKRDAYTVSTKIALAAGDPGQVAVMKKAEVRPAVERSLARLGLDHVDIMLMAVSDASYLDIVMNEHIPELEKCRDAGLIGFIGSSEQTRSDGNHEWLRAALPTGKLDVAMVGHNMINQSARQWVFPYCAEHNLGVFNIFTVRNVFWNLPRLREVLADMVERGVVMASDVDLERPLQWLLDEAGCKSLVEAAYRYAAYTNPVSTVMCGGLQYHEIKENVGSFAAGPLPAAAVERLRRIFSKVAEPVGN